MVELSGHVLDGATSLPRAATLRFHRDGAVVLAFDGEERRLSLEDVMIEPRLGETVRRVRLPGGMVFETHDNEGADAVTREHLGARSNWVHTLEQHLTAVTASALLVIAAGAVFTIWGIPTLAREAAFAVTPEQASAIGAGTLDLLDEAMSESELLDQDRARLRARFAEITDDAPPGYDFELVFRRGERFGANAFALPSGTVVLTDELVDLAQHEDEIVGVLAHEVGHVVHRHGLRHVIQGSSLAMVIVLLTGDLSSTSGFVAAVPTLLVESSYSRDFEREADDHAADWLAANDIPVEHFAAMLDRIGGAGDEADDEPGGGEAGEEDERDRSLLDYMASHPSSAERIARLRR